MKLFCFCKNLMRTSKTWLHAGGKNQFGVLCFYLSALPSLSLPLPSTHPLPRCLPASRSHRLIIRLLTSIKLRLINYMDLQCSVIVRNAISPRLLHLDSGGNAPLKRVTIFSARKSWRQPLAFSSQL